MEFSIDPSEESMWRNVLPKDVPLTVESASALAQRANARTTVLHAPVEQEFAMAAQFISRYLPLGHIKSTMPQDEAFVYYMHAGSDKWLQTLF